MLFRDQKMKTAMLLAAVSVLVSGCAETKSYLLSKAFQPRTRFI
jgi:hypothetical protein